MERTSVFNLDTTKIKNMEDISYQNKIIFLEDNDKKRAKNKILVKNFISFINNLKTIFENINIYFQLKIRIHNKLNLYNIYKYKNLYDYQDIFLPIINHFISKKLSYIYIISFKIISKNNNIEIYPRFDIRIDNFILNIFDNRKSLEKLESKIIINNICAYNEFNKIYNLTIFKDFFQLPKNADQIN